MCEPPSCAVNSSPTPSSAPTTSSNNPASSNLALFSAPFSPLPFSTSATTKIPSGPSRNAIPNSSAPAISSISAQISATPRTFSLTRFRRRAKFSLSNPTRNPSPYSETFFAASVFSIASSRTISPSATLMGCSSSGITTRTPPTIASSHPNSSSNTKTPSRSRAFPSPPSTPSFANTESTTSPSSKSTCKVTNQWSAKECLPRSNNFPTSASVSNTPPTTCANSASIPPPSSLFPHSRIPHPPAQP